MLQNKVAIITGGASGFGYATAELFAANGAEKADAAASAIADTGARTLAVAVDVSQEDQVKAMVDTTVDTFGQLDFLFNNAGMYAPGNVEETDTAAWMTSLAVNLTGVYLGCKYAMPHLKKSRGSIINTASGRRRHRLPRCLRLRDH